MMLRRRCLRWCCDDVICDNIATTLFEMMLRRRYLRRCCDDVVYDDVACDNVVCDDCKKNNITTLKWITN
jgi:hypothetical protein